LGLWLSFFGNLWLMTHQVAALVSNSICYQVVLSLLLSAACGAWRWLVQVS